MKHKYFVLATAALLFSYSSMAQRTTANTKTRTTAHTATLNASDKSFVQSAISSNNEAMVLAQMALQRSKDSSVRVIARQFLNDHVAAQKRLYAIAQIKSAVAYNNASSNNPSGNAKLPLTDNLDTRRNRTVTTMSNTGSNSNTSDPAAAQAGNGTVVAGVVTNQQTTPARTNYDTASSFGKNQTYNGITAIDNANGINNANRTDVGSYSGRFSETNTVAYSQNPQAYSQGTGTPAPANASYNQATTVNRTLSVLPNNGNDIMPDFATRTPDTVRQTGLSDGFEQPGTNLTFPNSPLYSKNTPNTRPNGNAGSDYGAAGVVVNNAQTNALNTAPYANNEINGNIVQTGQLQGTSNPAAVVNSSTALLNNTQVAYNNSNANRADQVAIQARPTGTIVVNNRDGAGTAGGTTAGGTPAVAVPATKAPHNGPKPVVAGSVTQQSTTPVVGDRNATMATMAGAFPSNNGFSTAITSTPAIATIRNTDTDAFDGQWAIQMNNNQQAAVQLYQAALKATHNAQVRSYINQVMPLLQGHQYALRQWQEKDIK